jgi:undecaprenyl diphosphate synthase
MSDQSIPKHIAIIPDGNRRWAKARGLEPWKGHEFGVENFENISDVAFKQGVQYLTFWAASEDNLTKRSKVEVKALLWLIEKFVSSDAILKKFVDNQIRVRVLGRWEALLDNKHLTNRIKQIQQDTASFQDYNLTILLGYDGQSEMLAALQHLSVTKQAVDAATLRAALWTADLPPVDLVIRTGGEPHWSAGFMMWHVANSQLYFSSKLWPDFGKNELLEALADYARRGRRMGS